MLRLILGRAGTGKTGLILDELRSRVLERRGGGWLIVPEQYSHEAERELSARCGDSASLYAEALSFTRLAHRVALRVGDSARTYFDRAGRLQPTIPFWRSLYRERRLSWIADRRILPWVYWHLILRGRA